MALSRGAIHRLFPASLLASASNDHHMNYAISKKYTNSTYKKLCIYLYRYFGILHRHMFTEYEVQIRDNSITSDGHAMLQKLHGEFEDFQYEREIHRILDPWVLLFVAAQPYPEGRINFVYASVGHVLAAVSKQIYIVQSGALCQRRIDNNKLCQLKSSTGPAVHNLTSIEIPQPVLDLISPGLHVVPNSTHDKDSVRDTVIKDLKSSAISYFRSSMGYYPSCADTIVKLDDLLKHLIMLTTCISTTSFYYLMRDLYTDEIDDFVKSIKFVDDALKPQDLISKFLPTDIIITTTDKNLGVALVPIQWYRETYASHCIKGGYPGRNE